MTSNQLPSTQVQLDNTSEYVEAKRDCKRNKSFYWLLILLSGIGLFFIFTRSQIAITGQVSDITSEKTAPESARILAVETMQIQPVQSYQVSRTYTGEIAAVRTSDLGFPRGGEINDILVQEGDRITKDTVLAKLDTRNLSAQRQQLVADKAGANAVLQELRRGARQEDIDEAKANVREIEKELDLQQKQLTRREFLYQEGAISREQLEEFASGEEVLKARLASAKSNLAELENGTRWEKIAAQQAVIDRFNAQIREIDVQIDQSQIEAPFAGIIAERQLDEGTVVSTGQSVVRLLENAPPEARIGIPTQTVKQLRVGSYQELKIAGQNYRGKITSILPEVDLTTRTQTVVMQLDQIAITQINPNQTVRLDLVETIEANGYWLSTKALTQGIRGLWSCYVATPTSTEGEYIIEQKAVEIIYQKGDRVLVRGTLQPGDRVVADGVHRLVPMQRVRLFQ